MHLKNKSTKDISCHKNNFRTLLFLSKMKRQMFFKCFKMIMSMLLTLHNKIQQNNQDLYHPESSWRMIQMKKTNLDLTLTKLNHFLPNLDIPLRKSMKMKPHASPESK